MILKARVPLVVRRSVAAVTLVLGMVSSTQADLFGLWRVHPPACSPDEDDEEEDSCARFSFAPCPWQQQGTLFLWSGATVGGPQINEPLVSDRPDFTESSVTVGWGITQLEMGYTFISDRENGTTQHVHSYPEILLRQGMIADWFELRLAWGLENQVLEALGGPQSQQNAAGDMNVGCKLALTPQEEWLPETGIILQMDLPTGSGSRYVLPGLNYLYSWELNEKLSLAGNTALQIEVDEESESRYLEFAQSMSLGISLTDRLGCYLEWFALMPAGAESALPEQYADGGFTWLFNNNLQFDVRAGVGLNESADDFFTGAGLVVRQ